MWGRIIINREEHEGVLLVKPRTESTVASPEAQHQVCLIDSTQTLDFRWTSTEPECTNIPYRFCVDGLGFEEWCSGTILFKTCSGAVDGLYCRRDRSEEEARVFDAEKRNTQQAQKADTEHADDPNFILIDLYFGDFSSDQYSDPNGMWTRRACRRPYICVRGGRVSSLSWENGERWILKPPQISPDSPFWKRHPDEIQVGAYDPDVLSTPIAITLGYWVAEPTVVNIDGQFRDTLRRALRFQSCMLIIKRGDEAAKEEKSRTEHPRPLKVRDPAASEEKIKQHTEASPPSLPDNQWLTIKEAASFAKVSEKTIRNWTKKDDIIEFKATGKMIRIKRASLDGYVKRERQTRGPKTKTLRGKVPADSVMTQLENSSTPF